MKKEISFIILLIVSITFAFTQGDSDKNKMDTSQLETSDSDIFGLIESVIMNGEYEDIKSIIQLQKTSDFRDLFDGGKAGFVISNSMSGEYFRHKNHFIILFLLDMNNHVSEIVDAIIIPKINKNDKILLLDGNLNGEFDDNLIVIADDDLMGETIQNIRHIYNFNTKEKKIIDVKDQSVKLYVEM